MWERGRQPDIPLPHILQFGGSSFWTRRPILEAVVSSPSDDDLTLPPARRALPLSSPPRGPPPPPARRALALSSPSRGARTPPSGARGRRRGDHPPGPRALPALAGLLG